MSYTPTTWAAGDTVTAAKLNKLEQGVAAGGGVLVVHETVSEGTHTLDKTWKQISDAANAGTVIYYINQDDSEEGNIMYAARIVYDGYFYCAYFSNTSGGLYKQFESETENGYPAYTVNDYPS